MRRKKLKKKRIKWDWRKKECKEWRESWRRKSKEGRGGKIKEKGVEKSLPYPLVPSKRDNEKEVTYFIDIFKMLKINLPLPEALQQMPFFFC